MDTRDTLTAYLILFGLVASIVLPATVSCESVYLYLYGATWCPHCKSLDQFFSRAYSDRHYFCKIDVDKNCQSKLNAVREYFTKNKGVSSEYLGYIPQTYVIRDGRYLIAIVVGGVTDPQFWSNITAMRPQDKVLLIIPPSAYEIPMTFEEQYELIQKFTYMPATSSPPSQQPTFSPQAIIPVILVALGSFAIAFAILKRRR